MSKVDEYISDLEGEQYKIVQHLHSLFANEFDMEPKIKYKIPFYYKNSWVCYLNPLKNNGVECAFTRGNELLIETPILLSKGRKQIKGIDLLSVNDITDELFEILHEALFIDETKPYSVKRNK